MGGSGSYPTPIQEEDIENSDVYDLHTRLSAMNEDGSEKKSGCFGKCKK